LTQSKAERMGAAASVIGAIVLLLIFGGLFRRRHRGHR